MTYFISAMHNGMTIRTELANEAEIDNVIAFLAKNPDFVWTVMYTVVDGVPVSVNLDDLDDMVIVEYRAQYQNNKNNKENKVDNKVEEKDKDDNIDNEPMNFFNDSDNDIFKSIIDTSYEYLDDDFIKNIQKRFV